MNKKYLFLHAAVLLCFLMTAVSCDNSVKEENERLRLENEQLRLGGQKDSLYIANMQSEMDQLYGSLDSMRTLEDRIRNVSSRMRSGDLKPSEGGETIDQSIADLENMLAANRRKISQLEQKLAGSGQENSALKKMLEELNKSIQDKDRYISELKQEIVQLQTEVQGWKSQYAVADSSLKEKDKKLESAEDQLSIGYYAIGTRKEMDDRGIIERKGLFKGKVAGISPNVKNENFTRVDTRYQEKISLSGKELEMIIPSRDESCYSFESENGGKALVIKDKKKFWENKYLVIVVK